MNLIRQNHFIAQLPGQNTDSRKMGLLDGSEDASSVEEDDYDAVSITSFDEENDDDMELRIDSWLKERGVTTMADPREKEREFFRERRVNRMGRGSCRLKKSIPLKLGGGRSSLLSRRKAKFALPYLKKQTFDTASTASSLSRETLKAPDSPHAC